MTPKIIRITTVPLSLKVLLKGQMKFISQSGYKVMAISSPGAVLDDVGQVEGVHTIPVSLTRSITPFSDLRAVWKLYRIFKRERPDIVHTHTPKAGTVCNTPLILGQRFS